MAPEEPGRVKLFPVALSELAKRPRAAAWVAAEAGDNIVPSGWGRVMTPGPLGLTVLQPGPGVWLNDSPGGVGNRCVKGRPPADMEARLRSVQEKAGFTAVTATNRHLEGVRGIPSVMSLK